MLPGVPECEDPELSVVMVSHGAWELTARAISALVAYTQCALELILVDNASDAETQAQLSELRNVRMFFNEENVGFGPANNQGAAVARADYLLLLNTDVFVHPGWLEPLLGAVAGPAVAAAVPRLLNADGSLQEAGCLLGRDGSPMLYGEGDDPDLPCYGFPRRIDYGSAACMLVRREDFARQGGFDARYAPAYYEDTDLCMRFARDGLSVMYTPASTVTHLRYGSGDRSSAIQLSERNHQLFVDRWREHLIGRPWTLTNAGEQAVIAARDAVATPRVLICAEPRETAAQQLVATLLNGWPQARITWTAGLIDGSEAAEWLARGVEVMASPQHTWLDHRLFHYDVIVQRRELEEELLIALTRTQPRALRLDLDGIPAGRDASLAYLQTALARAGITPERWTS